MIVLLVVVTANSLSLQHVFKVPVLVAHFFEHRQRGMDITVLDFLSMHYWGNDINDNDQARDMELPFKKVDFSQSTLSLFFQGGDQYDFSNHPAVVTYPTVHPAGHVSGMIGSLFRPPRVA